MRPAHAYPPDQRAARCIGVTTSRKKLTRALKKRIVRMLLPLLT